MHHATVVAEMPCKVALTCSWIATHSCRVLALFQRFTRAKLVVTLGARAVITVGGIVHFLALLVLLGHEHR